MSPVLSISRRLRSTPFTRRVTEAGVKGYTVYNHMLLPTMFESIEADYHHLKRDVQIWDVAVQRQVEVRGRDAAKLIQMLTPRSLKKMADDQCYYIPVVDETGGMLNDPVAVRHSEDRWWISIADSDLLYWIKGLARGMNLRVDVFEPDVSPLAIQGPKSNDLMARLFGEDIRDLRFFRHRKIEFNGRQHTIARSGFSVQGGFEIYVEGTDQGEPIWDALFEAGQGLNVRAGCPNLIERIEGGLLSYGNDMTRDNTPFEAGLGKFCKGAASKDCIGADALRQDLEHGPKRQVRGLAIAGEAVPPCQDLWPVFVNDQGVGHVSSAAWSPDLLTNVAIAMIDRAHWDVGTHVTVQTPSGPRDAEVRALPFI
ncbi:dimethylsulfoniopropionate demethylase [Litorimonas sp. RW-G-Af-16]|uniref:dimethylsulfoniopropionate demethylase n=1 Tax=Litorimonas sp. RW-G-Af-16 TaxID=3241168 RepID=UPI00390CBCDA